MKDRLLIGTLAGVGFLAALGINAVRGGLWQPASAPDSAPPARAEVQINAAPLSVADHPVPLKPAAVAATQPQPAPASDPAPTYEQQVAALDRAAAHSARSR